MTDSALFPMSADELADWYRSLGVRVLGQNGHYWQQVAVGFVEPLHLAGRLSVAEAKPPTSLIWGYRAVLANPMGANGSLPVHLLDDFEGYLGRLSSGRRRHYRLSQKRATIVALADAQPLLQEGHGVVLSALERTGHLQPPSAADYRTSASHAVGPGRLVLGGMVDGRLGGYLQGHAVGETAYIDAVHISTEALSTSMGTGLVVEFVEACRRSGQIREIIYGLHSREDEALCTFKASLQFDVRHLPAKVHINPAVSLLLRRRYPHKFYRLTGWDTGKPPVREAKSQPTPTRDRELVGEQAK